MLFRSDDDDVDREKLLRLLRRSPRNITVEQASSQAEALGMIREPQAHYVILCTAENAGAALRSFRIIDGKVTEETIQAVAQYPSALAG